MDVSETPRDVAFCAHTILSPDLLEVPDTREDARFADNPFVQRDPGVRFYAGAPLITPNGQALGSLCVIDLVRRNLTASHIDANAGTEGSSRMAAPSKRNRGSTDQPQTIRDNASTMVREKFSKLVINIRVDPSE